MTMAPRIIPAHHFGTYLKIGEVSDGVESGIRQGMEFLEAYDKDHADTEFREFLDELHETVVHESCFSLPGVLFHHELTDYECYQIITVLLRAAIRFAPGAAGEPSP